MYNEERKRRFIEYKSDVSLPPNFLEKLFNKTEEFEEKYNMDVARWQSTQIIEFYMFLDKRVLETLLNIHSQLMGYVAWCIQNGEVSGIQNHFEEIKQETLQTCLNEIKVERGVFTYKTLVKGLAKVERDSSKFIVLGLYEGLLGELFCEIVNANINNLNGNEFTTCTSRKLMISDRLRRYMLNAAEETEMRFERCVNRGGHEQVTELTVALVGDPGQVVKNSARVFNNSERQASIRIYNRVLRTLEEMDFPRLTPRQILESGRLHMIQTDIKELSEEIGKAITPDEYFYAEEYQERKWSMEERYGVIQSYKRYIGKYRKYLVNYKEYL